MKEASLTQVTWAEVEKKVKKVNPELHKIICELDPGPKLRLYLGRYPYGAQFLQHGKYQVPIDGEFYPLSHPKVSKQIREDLSYNIETNPVSLILKNCIEIFLDKPFTVNPISFLIVPQGAVISTTRVTTHVPLQPAFLWNISSGVRSIFMLPKITQARKIKRLRTELNIDINQPTSIGDHWELFYKIANSQYVEPWETEILAFSKNWFENTDDEAFKKFKLYFIKKTQSSIGYLGTFYIWEMVFSMILRNRGLRPSIYINNIVKHLFQIGLGVLPGLTPNSTEDKAPIKAIQKAFIEIYDLQTYIPSIITPGYYNMENEKEYMYYSLQNPNLLDTPKKTDSSNISDLYDIKSLLDKYLNDIRYENFNLQETKFHKFSIDNDIDAFHPNPNNYSAIENIEEIIAQDPRFKKTLYPCKNKEVALFSPLFKGCFRVRKK